MGKKLKKKYELAILWTNHTWEDDNWEIATSAQEAEEKCLKKLEDESDVAHVTVICEQDIEDGDEEIYGD